MHRRLFNLLSWQYLHNLQHVIKTASIFYSTSVLLSSSILSWLASWLDIFLAGMLVIALPLPEESFPEVCHPEFSLCAVHFNFPLILKESCLKYHLSNQAKILLKNIGWWHTPKAPSMWQLKFNPPNSCKGRRDTNPEMSSDPHTCTIPCSQDTCSTNIQNSFNVMEKRQKLSFESFRIVPDTFLEIPSRERQWRPGRRKVLVGPVGNRQGFRDV